MPSHGNNLKSFSDLYRYRIKDIIKESRTKLNRETTTISNFYFEIKEKKTKQMLNKQSVKKQLKTPMKIKNIRRLNESI